MKRLTLRLAVLGLVVGGLGLADAEYLRHQLNDRIAAASRAFRQFDQQVSQFDRQIQYTDIAAAVCSNWASYQAALNGLETLYAGGKNVTISYNQVQADDAALNAMRQDLRGLSEPGVSEWATDGRALWHDLGNQLQNWNASKSLPDESTVITELQFDTSSYGLGQRCARIR